MTISEKLKNIAIKLLSVFKSGVNKGVGANITAYYNTLQDAVSEINSVNVGKIGTYTDNDGIYNIVLLSDITIASEVNIGRDCILRLNGYVITENADGCITCAANVKIDGSIKRSEIVRNVDNDYSELCWLLCSNSGTLDIYKGKYTVTATANTTATVYGILAITNGDNSSVSLDDCTIDVTNLGTASCRCFYVYRREGSMAVKKCSINASSNGALYGIYSITHDFTLIDTTINAAVLTNQKACYGAFYSAVNSDGTAYTNDGIFNVNNCNITATGEGGGKNCSAIYVRGTLTVNGGKYFGTREGLAGKHNLSQISDCVFEGCRHGGAYISGSARVQNSMFRITTQRGNLPYDANGVYYGAMYTGDDVDLYMDGCTFDADEEIDGYTGHGIAVSANWDNTGGIVYLSNTNFIGNHLSDIRVDRGNVVYLGENVSYRTVLTPNLGDSEKPYGILDKSTYGGIRFMWDKHGNIIDFTEYYEIGKQAEYDRFWDSFQQNGTRKKYFYAFAGTGWNPDTFNPKYPIKIVERRTADRYCESMFAGFMNDSPKNLMSLTPEVVDFSEAKLIQNTFDNACFDTVTVDFTNATSLYNAFVSHKGGAIRVINLKVTDKCTNYSGAFQGCANTEEINFTVDSVIAATVDFKSCTKLTLASAKSILTALKDLAGTGSENSVTIALPSETWALLDADGNTAPNGVSWREYAQGKCWQIK